MSDIDPQIESTLADMGITIPKPIDLPVDEPEEEPKGDIAQQYADMLTQQAEARKREEELTDLLSARTQISYDGNVTTIASLYPNGSGFQLKADTLQVHTGNPKDLIGDTKADLSLVPSAASLYLAAGFADGAQKYGPYNWRENKVKARVYVAAAMRHLAQYLDGENIDPASNVPHIGHALSCLAIIADATETGNLIDDRPLPGAASDLIRRYKPDTKFNTAP